MQKSENVGFRIILSRSHFSTDFYYWFYVKKRFLADIAVQQRAIIRSISQTLACDTDPSKIRNQSLRVSLSCCENKASVLIVNIRLKKVLIISSLYSTKLIGRTPQISEWRIYLIVK